MMTPEGICYYRVCDVKQSFDLYWQIEYFYMEVSYSVLLHVNVELSPKILYGQIIVDLETSSHQVFNIASSDLRINVVINNIVNSKMALGVFIMIDSGMLKRAVFYIDRWP